MMHAEVFNIKYANGEAVLSAQKRMYKLCMFPEPLKSIEMVFADCENHFSVMPKI